MNSEFVDTWFVFTNHKNLIFKMLILYVKLFENAKLIFLINHLMKSKVILKIINSLKSNK